MLLEIKEGKFELAKSLRVLVSARLFAIDFKAAPSIAVRRRLLYLGLVDLAGLADHCPWQLSGGMQRHYRPRAGGRTARALDGRTVGGRVSDIFEVLDA